MAQKGCDLTGYKSDGCVAALAAAHAEYGDFEKVIEYQMKAIELIADKEFVGIGISFDRIDGMMKILDVMQSAPAYASGLAAGDIIKAVDGMSINGLSAEDMANKIEGPQGTKITLTVIHLGKDIDEEITVTRDMIVKPVIIEYEKRLAVYRDHKSWRE